MVRSGPMPASAERRDHIDVVRETRRRPRARVPANTRFGCVQPLDRNPVLDQIGRAGETRSAACASPCVTEWMSPSAAAVTASSPSSAPVGTMIWPPCALREFDQFRPRQQRAGAQHHDPLAGRQHRPANPLRSSRRARIRPRDRHAREGRRARRPGRRSSRGRARPAPSPVARRTRRRASAPECPRRAGAPAPGRRCQARRWRRESRPLRLLPSLARSYAATPAAASGA